MDTPARADERVIIIGAGPAGLTAARALAALGRRPIVLEKNSIVGGLARTEQFKGFFFDMGGHRFFTKEAEVNKIWREVLGADFRRRPVSLASTSIAIFFTILSDLSTRSGASACAVPRSSSSATFAGSSFLIRSEDTFEQWVTNRFGRRLFQTFFKTYTEKVWGIPCSELRAEWAAQRIREPVAQDGARHHVRQAPANHQDADR